MSAPHRLHDLQAGLGQTGKFGEIFIGLGALIFILGAVLATLGHLHFLTDGLTPDKGNTDAVTVGWLFLFEGLGFTLFGVMIMLAGWGRQHGEVT
ncbi:MAG TPA: hypothetical protein VM241_05305 [Candidatus Thermoplasmatota archaeon]|nr:hypothetical protein [Candidatus Thermoplasmatota archaeon]